MKPTTEEIVATLREYAPDADGTQRYILIPAAGRGGVAEYLVTVIAHRTDIMRDAADLIEQLQKELIDERYRHDRYADFCVAQGEELSRLKAQQRWIPVTERLPEDGFEVLVYTDRYGGRHEFAYYVPRLGAWYQNCALLIPNVTIGCRCPNRRRRKHMNQSVRSKATENLNALANGAAVFHGYKLAYGCIVGSHAYGTATTNSDIDVRGVFVRDAFDILTNHDPQNLSSATTDTVLYSFDNFVKMLANGNPNIVDMVGVGAEFRLKSSPEMQLVFDNMHLFMSKRMGRACRGFANKQRKIFENKTSFELDKDKLGKAMMHYVRTMHNGIHTLHTGECVARYTSPEPLIRIRNGEHIDPVTMRPDTKFFRIMDLLEDELDAALNLDLLPEEPHYSEINRLLAEVNARALGIAPHTYF